MPPELLRPATRASTTGSAVSTAAGQVIGGVMGAVARVRRTGRPLHPVGHTTTGTLHRHGARPRTGVDWLDDAGSDPAVVRVSRSVGLPGFLPDVPGLAVRVEVDARPVDLLFSGTGWGPLTRFVLRPSRDPDHPMGTLLPYESPDGPLVMGARRTGTDVLELSCAVGRGPWRAFAELEVDADDVTPAGPDAEVSFDAVLHPPPGLAVPGWVRRLREPSYAAARRRRAEREH